MTRAAAVLVLLLALAACGGDNVTSPPTISGTTSTSAAVTSSSAGGTTTSGGQTTTTFSSGSCHDGSGPAHFDASSGTYSTYLTAISATKRTLSFNVIQFLVGDDAIAAWHEQNPTDPDGPPNDYFIVDDSEEVRTAPVSSNATVRLVRLQETATADLKPGTFAELPTYFVPYHDSETGNLSHNPFWLTLQNGAITDICEQFVP